MGTLSSAVPSAIPSSSRRPNQEVNTSSPSSARSRRAIRPQSSPDFSLACIGRLDSRCEKERTSAIGFDMGRTHDWRRLGDGGEGRDEDDLGHTPIDETRSIGDTLDRLAATEHPLEQRYKSRSPTHSQPSATGPCIVARTFRHDDVDKAKRLASASRYTPWPQQNAKTFRHLRGGCASCISRGRTGKTLAWPRRRPRPCRDRSTGFKTGKAPFYRTVKEASWK